MGYLKSICTRTPFILCDDNAHIMGPMRLLDRINSIWDTKRFLKPLIRNKGFNKFIANERIGHT